MSFHSSLIVEEYLTVSWVVGFLPVDHIINVIMKNHSRAGSTGDSCGSTITPQTPVKLQCPEMGAITPVDHFTFGKDKMCTKTCYNKFQAEDDGGKK